MAGGKKSKIDMRLDLAQALIQIPRGWSTCVTRWCAVGKSPDGRHSCYIYFHGGQEWLRDEVLHRDDGPALVETDGREYWYRNGACIGAKAGI